MNGAQRTAFIAMLRIAEQMSNACFNLKQDQALPVTTRDSLDRMQTRWDAARNRYFELENEAAKAKARTRRKGVPA